MTLLENTLGLDFVNDHMIALAQYMGKFTTTHMNSFTQLATVLGAIFAMVAIAMELYKVMGRGEPFDILAIGRPFLFALVLSVWPGFCNALMAPGQTLENGFREVYEVEKAKVYALRENRIEAAANHTDLIREKQAAAQQAEVAAGKNSDENVLSMVQDFLGNATDWIRDQFRSWALIADAYMANWIEGAVMWLGELAWQVMVYFTFLAKNIFLCVLCMFGPVFFIASILPAWENVWTQWVGKMIAVSFYGVMAYIVMIFSMQLMMYTLEADIKSLTQATDFIGVGNFTNNLWGSTTLTLTAMLVGYKALHLVPELASWVFPSERIMAAEGFVSGMKSTLKTGSIQGSKRLYKGCM